jgi:peptide methionine sulfoxide reductase MsrB
MTIEYVHAACGGEIEYVTDETNSARMNYYCAKCNEYLGFFIDGGTVDLDEIRASVSGHPDNEFTVRAKEL